MTSDYKGNNINTVRHRDTHMKCYSFQTPIVPKVGGLNVQFIWSCIVPKVGGLNVHFIWSYPGFQPPIKCPIYIAESDVQHQ